MPLKRSMSTVHYSGHTDDFHHITSPDPQKIRRVLSMSRIEGTNETPFVSYAYRTSTYPTTHYRQAWDVYRDQWYDRRYYTSPVTWPYASWRFGGYSSANAGQLLDYSNTVSLYPKTNRAHDPYSFSGRSSYYPYRPWVYESQDIGRAMKLQSMDLISRDTLEKYWLMPRSWESRWDTYKPPYRHATWYTSPRRYYYSY